MPFAFSFLDEGSGQSKASKGMELFLFQHSNYLRLYNCSSFPAEQVPLEVRQRPILGSIFIVLFAIYELLYLPCMHSIWLNRSLACYKFLFFIGLMDMANLWIAGLLTGILAIRGDVFCTNSLLIYFGGAIGNAIFCAESSAEVILLLNRCLEILAPKTAKKLFQGKRAWLWMGFASAYAVFWLFKVKALLFSGLYFNWFFDPHIGYDEEPKRREQYTDVLNAAHDLVLIAVALPAIYLIFIVAFFLKARFYKGISQTAALNIYAAQKLIFLQVFLISFIHVCSVLLYVYIQFVEGTRTLILLNMFCWLHIHGAPPVIFLLMNKTIQKDFLDDMKAIGKLLAKKPFIGSSTVGAWTN